ncbi:MAG TPA: SUMF1/EgtB/PvdO family nonheme iron enzyme, partial [bacterium]|nr:SUMF1/EgtB/PvdO family nonheme iron enzyme [bacterium]
MKKLFYAAALLIAALLAGCGPQTVSSLSLKPDDDAGFIFGRILPIFDAADGYVAFERAGGSTIKCAMTDDGYFILQNKAGRVRLTKVGYQDAVGVQTVTLSTPATLEVVGGRVTYVGQIIIAPHSADVYLTDDFPRDRQWLTANYAFKGEPQSAFPNRSFYVVMDQFAAVPAPPALLDDGRANIAGREFLMGDVWPGNLVQAFGASDLSQLPPHRVTLGAYRLDAYPTPAAALERRGERPATEVSWAEADAYCRARGGRLPTEAEYELAMRGPAWGGHLYAGAPPPGRNPTLGGGPAPEEPGWIVSPYGVKAQADALAEWTADWYGADTYRTMSVIDPTGPANGTRRVVRAGPYRFAVAPDSKLRGLGFRCAYPQAGVTPAAATPETPPAQPTRATTEPTAAAARAKVAADLLAGPADNAAVIGRVALGEVLTVLARSGNFTLVRLANGDEGFVRVEVVGVVEGVNDDN